MKKALLANWARLVVPLLVSSLSALAFSRFLTWYLLDDGMSVNAEFVGDAWQVLLLAATGVCLIVVVYCGVNGKTKAVVEVSKRNISLADSLLILLPLTPIVQYVLRNQDILTTAGSFAVVGFFIVFSFLFVLFIPLLFSWVSSGVTLAIIGMAFSFTITNMASLTLELKWFERGDTLIQFGVFLAISSLGLLLYNFVGRRFTRFVIFLYFVANSINSYPFSDTQGHEILPVLTDNKMVEIVNERTPLMTPNIYFLVYDAYVSNETMGGYGIDNSAQEDYLVGAGFQIYPHTFSISAATVSTISRVFSVSRPYSGAPRMAAAGGGVVQRLLQRFGYETCGVFWSDYFFQGGGSYYDSSFPALKDTQWMLVKAILMGEFRFDAEYGRPSRSEFVDNKISVFSEVGGSPKFVYMHENLPGHSQNSGACLPDELERFERDLKRANEEMKKNVDLIVEKHPDAIVIVAGDHGPYLTKNCTRTRDEYDISDITRLDVQDRYGTFLAIKWPNDEFVQNTDIVVLQDLFPAVFSVLFDDPEFLVARIMPLTGSAAVTTSGVEVREGLIKGGVNSGEPLFINE